MSLINGPGAVGGGGTVIRPPKDTLSITTDTPGAPSAGDIYIVPVGATGAFAGHDNEIATYTTAWTFYTPIESDMAYVDDADDYFVFTGVAWKEFETGLPMVHALGGAQHSASTLSNLNTKVSDATLINAWDEAQIYYVGKGGNDSNDGKSIDEALLTIGAAVALIAIETPGAANRFTIEVLDAGIYDEYVILQTYTLLNAPTANISRLGLVGDFSAAIINKIDAVLEPVIILGDDCYLRAHHVFSPTAGATGLTTGATSTGTIIDIDILEVTGGGVPAIAHMGFTLSGRVGEIIITSGTAVISSIAAGSIDLQINTVTLTGATSKLLDSTVANDEISLRIGRVIGSGCTEAITLTAGSAYLAIGSLTGFTSAYTVSGAASLYMLIGKIAGTETNTSTGVINISKAGGSAPLNGFPNRTDSTIAMNGANFEVDAAGTNFKFWSNGRVFTKSALEDVAIANDKDLHYVYYTDEGVLTVSTSLWDLTADTVPIATVFKDGANYVVTDERHGWRRDRNWHKWAHDTIGSRYLTGLTGTFLDASFSIAQGIVMDEDISYDTGGAETTCQLWYRDAGLTTMRVELASGNVYRESGGGVIQYDDGSGTPQDVTAPRYVNNYVYATNSPTNPIVAVIGQAQHTTIGSARNEDLPSILLSTAEWKLLYRATYRNVGGVPTYVEALDLRLTSTGPAQAATPTSHAALTDRDAANAHPADAVAPDATGWSGNLSSADDDVQKALDTLDTMSGGVVTLIPADGTISTVLNAATSGSSFWLADGSHVPDAQIDLSGKDNISIMAGRGAVITAGLTTGVIDPLFILGDNVGLHFHGLRFALTADAADLAVFGFENGTTSSGITWDDCEAVNSSAGNRAIFIDYKDVTGDTSDFSVRNCSISGHWHGLVRLDANAGTHEKWRIKDNSAVTTATATPEAAVELQDGGATAVKDCQIEGNQFDAFFYGVSLAAAVDCSILGNSIYAAGSHGIIVTGTGCIINDNWIDDPGTNGIDVTGADNTINGNRITSAVIGIDLADGSDNCVVNGNSIDTTSAEGISVVNCNFCTFNGNVLNDCATRAIYSTGGNNSFSDNVADAGAKGIESTGARCILSDNFFYNGTDYGISCTGNDCTITGNVVYHVSTDGIVVAATGCVISNNTILDPTDNGIDVTGADNTISGNRITDAVIGIDLNAGSTACVVSGNNIDTMSGNGIDVNGADNTITGNRIISSVIAIDLAASPNCTVNGNSIDITSAQAINLTTSDDCTVNGNNINAAAGDGINLSGIADCVVNDNVIFNSGAHGIDATTSTGCVINDNMITNPTTNGIDVNGIDNTISGNRVTAAVIGIDLNTGSDNCMVNDNSFSSNTTNIFNGGVNNEINGKVENLVTTTDATDTVVSTIAIPDDSAVRIEVDVTAFSTDTANQATYKYVALVSRRSAGIAVLEGAVTEIHAPIESDAAYVATLDIDGGNNARIRVTGAVGDTVNWKARHVVTEVS